MNSDDLQTLVDFGLFSEQGLAKLARLIRGVQALSGNGEIMVGATKAQGRRGPGRKPGRPAGGGGGKRAARGSFNPTKDELAKLRDSGMTAKEIAAKAGVSMATVNNRLREHGLTSGRRGRPKASASSAGASKGKGTGKQGKK